MPIRPGEYHRPVDWASARELLRRAPPLLLGPRVSIPLYGDAEAVVDLSRLDLAYIKVDDEVRLGALTPLQDLADSPQLQALANGLPSEAVRLTAHYGLRNLATVGGALLSRDGPPEILLALLALDAVVVIRGAETRELPITNYSLNPGDVIAEVRFPQPANGTKGALERVARTPRDESIVSAAAVIEVIDGVCRKVRLAVAGGTPRPQRMTSAEKLLEGQPLTPEQLQGAAQAVMAEADPVADYRGSAEYRQAMAGVLARRALEAALKRSLTSEFLP